MSKTYHDRLQNSQLLSRMLSRYRACCTNKTFLYHQSWTNCWKWKPNMAKIYVWEEREFYWKESLHLKIERLYKLLVFRIYYSEVRHNKCVRPHCQSVRQNEIIYVNIIISFLYHIFLTDRKYDYWSIIFLRYLNRPSIPT